MHYLAVHHGAERGALALPVVQRCVGYGYLVPAHRLSASKERFAYAVHPLPSL
ncbi:Uncharacterised protein [Vibrio cholerae]|nr:Uncharacterised protein [Vibrio cholerae]CSD02194.1 Uncharacterised protein [Vibrio cholerae]